MVKDVLDVAQVCLDRRGPVVAFQQQFAVRDSDRFLVDVNDPAAVSGVLSPASRSIDVPVLLVVGEKDVLFCGFLARDCSNAEALRKQEAPYFGPAAELSTYVLPESGHSIALHKNASEYREATRAWLHAQFGTLATH